MSTQAKINAASKFLSDAPPGEVKDVFDDIKAIIEEDEDIIEGLNDAFENYNIDQFSIVKLPGIQKSVIISKFNSLGSGKFFDEEAGKSFDVHHASLKVKNVEEYASENSSVGSSVIDDVKHYVSEHFPEPSAYGVISLSEDRLAIVIVGNKYSPSNFWNGRWRSSYEVDLASNSISGSIDIDVHYYEDGNVRLKTHKEVSSSFTKGQAVKAIGVAEKAYQEQLNLEFSGLGDGAFKSLRRQLPVTRSKIEWGKAIGTYRLGQDIGGGRSK
ncbi:F-actin-capping protein subunit alpha [Lipomyces japonicus]|uniref:F-actin-capping protein subunit alpha n=1 Tax=Lipomyces japonicus TaxID=56871 RepID=UPI0034CDB436